jgi:hypothetical protein
MQNNSRNTAVRIILVVDDEALLFPAGAKVWKAGSSLDLYFASRQHIEKSKPAVCSVNFSAVRRSRL